MMGKNAKSPSVDRANAETSSMTANPYESPAHPEVSGTRCEQFPHISRTRVTLAGMWRGAKFGALVGSVIVGCLGALMFVASLLIAGIADTDVSRPSELVSALGGFAVGLLLSAIYGAVAGAIIVGLREAIRFRPHGPLEHQVSHTPQEMGDRKGDRRAY